MRTWSMGTLLCRAREKIRVEFLQPCPYLLLQNGQVLHDLREISRGNAARQIIARRVSFLRMRLDLAHPFLAGGGILRGQRIFETFDHALMLALANRNPIAAGPQSNVHQRKNAVVRRLKAKIVGDAFHLRVRLRAVHNAE